MTPLQKEACRAIVNVFETGKIRGDYSAIAVMRGDTGHLSYGRSQVSLGSGNLFGLLQFYCVQKDARFAGAIRPLLTRFRNKDLTLDTDDSVKKLLRDAAIEDPIMRLAQDSYFNREFLGPALAHAEDFGVTGALAQTVVYDSHIQGGWKILSPRVGKVNARGEQDWTERYIQSRREWLLTRKAPLPATAYRMDSLGALAKDGNWDLHLPLRVHGVTITEEALKGGEVPPPGQTARALRVTTPYLRGDDVTALQKALAANGLPAATDGVYGPFTDALVQKWQKQKGITETGAGEATLKSLGLPKQG